MDETAITDGARLLAAAEAVCVSTGAGMSVESGLETFRGEDGLWSKVNVEESQDLAAKFHIHSIPTLLVFKAGVVQEQMVGALRKADLQAKLNAYL